VQLHLDPDQLLFRDTVRKFLSKEMPVARVRELADDPAGFDREWWRRGAEMGWTAFLVPEDQGGGSVSGRGLVDLAIAAEEMGREVSPGPLVPTNVVAAALADAAPEGRFDEALERLVAGDAVASWCVYEPPGGWSPETPGVEIAEKDGGYVLNGVKDRVEAGNVADLLLVPALGPDGVVQLLVDATASGVDVRPMESVDTVRRYAQITFSDVRVPATALVTDAEASAAAIQRQLDIAVALQCAETVGAISRVFELTMQWAFDRYSFGRPLASYQALKHRFADMRVWLEACAATAAAAADAVQARSARAAEAVSVAKSYIGDKAPAIVQDCVQMHGGIGVTWEHDIHLYLRRVIVNRAMFGTPNEHRLRLTSLLGVGDEETRK